MPRGTNIRQVGAGGGGVAVHGPDCRQAVVVLPENVRLVVAVEIGSRSDMPRGPNIRQDRLTSHRGAVHGPDCRQAAVILQKDGLAIAVEGVWQFAHAKKATANA